MMTTKIEWVARPGTMPESWNPVTGCDPVSEGCANCYARRMARRLAGRFGYPEYPHHFDVTLHPDRLEQPLRWRKPRTVFVCSMADLFHKDVVPEVHRRIFEIIVQTPRHTYQVLTKRPVRMRDAIDYWFWSDARVQGGVPDNLWLGVTSENQEAADKRILLLLQTQAKVRFVSIEPMLGPVDVFTGLTPILRRGARDWVRLDWVIVGGETGPGARPMKWDWARAVRDQCVAAGVPFFYKQGGDWLWRRRPNKNLQEYAKRFTGRLLDGREWNEWPG